MIEKEIKRELTEKIADQSFKNTAKWGLFACLY